MSKIVFFDIDGTLLDHDKNLPGTAKAAIQSLQSDGIYTAIATGRAPFMFTHLLEELNMQSYVSFNGQYVVFENEVLYTNPLNETEMEKLEKEASAHGHSLVYLNEKTMKSSVSQDDLIEESLGELKLAHPESDPEFYKKNEIYQALLFGKQEQLDYLDGFDAFTFIRWHKHSVDVVPKFGSKAEGIKKMVSRLGFDMKDVYAFGDGLNDIEMLQEAGTGIAMGNAPAEVKQFADFVTDSVDADGIVRGLMAAGLLPETFRIPGR